MDMQEPESPELEDPEIAALLAFEPVTHKMPRADGWTAERQRGFIAALAETGCQEQAAHRVGMTGRGAYNLRRQAGGEGFAGAWTKAIALHKKRRGRRPAPTARGGGVRESGATGQGPSKAALAARASLRVAAEDLEPEEALEICTLADLLQPLMDKYLGKLKEERSCRLEGRIVEADFCVRQLTAIEIMLDLAGGADELIDRWRLPNDMHMIEVAATPMSVLLAGIRRDYWAEQGEPERPGLPPLGIVRDGVARGEDFNFNAGRDGDYRDWRRRQDEKRRHAAEAQKAWEEKAKADAAAWAERVRQAGGGPDGPGGFAEAEEEGKVDAGSSPA
jgi:hypothetical protein